MHRFPPLHDQPRPNQPRPNQPQIIAKPLPMPLPSLPWAELALFAIMALVLALT